jgi:predicted nucleic acid-binding protein
MRSITSGTCCYERSLRDAFYAVLAEALEIPLVTADRRLATAVPGALLVA